MTARLIDSLKTVQRYTSAVIAWHQEDKVTPEQMRRCVLEFMALARSGLSVSRLDWLAVRHDDHVHIIMPKVDLLSGKAFNPMPPGWEKSFGALRDAWNYENNWARPDDPARARTLQPGRAPVEERDPRLKLSRLVEDALVAGEVVDRAGVVRLLADQGEITRQGRDYVSVRLDGRPRPVRLQGPLFARDLDVQAMTAAIERNRSEIPAAPSGCGVDAATARARAYEARRRVEEAMKRRREYVSKRFPDDLPRPQSLPVWVVEHADRAAEREAEQVLAKDQAAEKARERAAGEPHVPMDAKGEQGRGLGQRPSETRPQAGSLPGLETGYEEGARALSHHDGTGARDIKTGSVPPSLGGGQQIDPVALQRELDEDQAEWEQDFNANPFSVPALEKASKRREAAERRLQAARPSTGQTDLEPCDDEDEESDDAPERWTPR